MTVPAVQHEDPSMVSVSSVVLGELLLPETSVMNFPDGVHGFEAHKRFVLVPAAREGLFWMQSLAHKDICFLLADPFVVVPGYEVDLGATERLTLGLADPNDVLILAIVTLSPEQDAMPTANLRGPIVFNVRTRVGRQVMTSSDSHDVKTPVDILALAERQG